MNCQKARKWLSQALDGELDDRSRVQLEQHVAACPSCQEVRAAWAKTGEMLRSEVVEAPSAEVMWSDVQRALRLAQAEPEQATASWRLKWAAAFVGLALLGMGLWGTLHSVRPGNPALPRVDQQPTVEWAEAELPGTSTMVYEDAENDTVVIWLMAADNGGDNPKGT